MATGPNSEKNTPARQRAQAKYNSKPEQKKKRASRNKARRHDDERLVRYTKGTVRT
jgi:hypothetical protein